MTRFIVALFALGAASTAFGYPEFARYGYFSCTSCHVSPGGGGALTDYGRSFEAERLATFFKKDEELLLHGAIGATPPWLVVGGNFRQIQTLTETSRSKDGRWIPMQRDVEVCVHPGPAWACVTGGIVKPASIQPDGRPVYGARRANLRVDIGENFLVRAGRFMPRYGLMIANHTSSIRQGLGFDQYAETDQLEATFVSERLEVALARGFGRKLPLPEATDDDAAPATTLTVAAAATEKTRVGLSYHHESDDEGTVQKGGIFTAATLGDATFLLAEIDHMLSRTDRAPGDTVVLRSAASHARLGYETTRGLFPYLLHEASFRDLTDGATRRDTFGLGIQWFPRPHFEIDAFAGHVLSHEAMTYANAAYLLVHYHL